MRYSLRSVIQSEFKNLTFPKQILKTDNSYLGGLSVGIINHIPSEIRPEFLTRNRNSIVEFVKNVGRCLKEGHFIVFWLSVGGMLRTLLLAKNNSPKLKNYTHLSCRQKTDDLEQWKSTGDCFIRRRNVGQWKVFIFRLARVYLSNSCIQG